MGENLGKLIKELRSRRLDWGLRELEDKTGINRGTLSKIEKGELDAEPGDDRLAAIAEALSAGLGEEVEEWLTRAAVQDKVESLERLNAEFRKRLKEAGVPMEFWEEAVKAVSPEAKGRVVEGKERLEVRPLHSMADTEIKATLEGEEEAHIVGSGKSPKSALDLLDSDTGRHKGMAPPRRPGPPERQPVERFYAGAKGAIHVFEDLDENKQKQVRQLARLLQSILEE